MSDIPATLQFPEEWAPLRDEEDERSADWWGHWESITVVRQTLEFSDIETSFVQSMPTVDIVDIKRIQHRGKWYKFQSKRAEFKRKNDHGANELLLWHGTTSADPVDIISSYAGLDQRLSNGGFYGHGLYFAEYARYVNGDQTKRYFYSPPNSDHRQMLLCKVLCGNVKQYGNTGKEDFNPLTDLVDDEHSTQLAQAVLESVCGGPNMSIKQIYDPTKTY